MNRVPNSWICAFLIACFCPLALMAAPTLAVNPTSIDREYSGTVQVDMGTVMSGSIMLLLYNDVDGDGIQDLEDNVLWIDVLEDNGAEWSPNQFSDTDATPGLISVDLRLFTLANYPNTAGSYFWQAVDAGFGSSPLVPFTITQPSLAQSVSGQVLDDDTSLPLPGTMVTLEPFCDQGDSAYQLFSTWTDMSGNYTIEVPATLACDRFAVVAMAPQYITWALDLPVVVFTGANNFTGQDFRLEPGDYAVTGSVQYQNGPRIGQGVVGLRIEAESDNLPGVAITLTDNNGNFTIMLDDGDWILEGPEAETSLTQGLAPNEGIELQVTVSGSGVAAGTMQVPAANAYFTGTLTDDGGTPIAGRRVSATRDGICDPNCYAGADLTDVNGDFVLGVVAPNGPSTFTYNIQVVDPLDGSIAQNRGCETISSGQTITGRDLTHVSPNSSLSGTAMDKDGNSLDNYCLRANEVSGCTWYSSMAKTDCNGDYSIPVIDGDWSVSSGGNDMDVFFRQLDVSEVWRNITVAGASQSGMDYILGTWNQAPLLRFLDNPIGQENGHILLSGRGFDMFGGTPEVWINGSVAVTVLAYRPATGDILAQLPGGLSTGVHSIAVNNIDLNWMSNDLCIDITAGTYTSACSITGSTFDPGINPLPGSLVLAYDSNGDFAGGVESDGAATFTLDLPAAGNYDLLFVPPFGSGYINHTYPTVACAGVRNHAFATGSNVTGQVITTGGDDLVNALVIAVEIGGSGYRTWNLTGNDGSFSLMVPNGNFVFVIRPPMESRYVAPSTINQGIAGNTNLGQIQLADGVIFCGQVLDAEGQGTRARIEAFRKSDQLWRGRVFSTDCTGQFDIALMPGEEVSLEILGTDFTMDQPARVKWITPMYDTTASHPFTIFSRDTLQHTGSEPRILWVGEYTQGQEGQPMDINGENFAGTTLDVLFSDGASGFVAGTNTLWDEERGFAATKIPSGAASGTMKVRVDGVDSLEVPFELLPGVFNAGSFTASGLVQDQGPSPVQDVLVLLVERDTGNSCGEDDYHLLDYGLTDGSGNYAGLNHNGGDLAVAFLAPYSTMLASNFNQQNGVVGNMVVDASLQVGSAVSVRAVDDDTVPAPVPGAIFESYHDTLGFFDQVLTDTNGDATLYLLDGDYEFVLISPVDSRVNEIEWFDTVAGPNAYGDTTMTRGVMISTQGVSSIDQTPQPISIGESFASGMGWQFFREDAADVNGVVHLSGDANSTVNIRMETADGNLVGQEFTTDVTDADCILYPPFQFLPAGYLSGTVVEDGTFTPIADIELGVVSESGGMPDWSSSFFGRTCTDGTYEVKVPAGDYFLAVNFNQMFPYISEWYQDALCQIDANVLQVLTGQTTTANVELDKGGTITGTATLNGNPLTDTNVCVTNGALGTCWNCTSTDGSGNYSITVPAGTGYQVELNSNFGPHCYDGFPGCSGFTPVDVTAETTTPNIDFALGCATPGVIYSDDMESGIGTWAATGLWHQVTDPTCAPASSSSSTSWYFGQDGTCDFDTGSTTTCELTSATFSAVPEGAQLTFDYRLEQDGNCGVTDDARIELSVDGGSFFFIRNLCDTEGNWKTFWLDLTSFYDAGSDLQIRFVFDSVDNQNNFHLGWMIDDVELSTCSLSAPGEPSADGSGIPLVITDLGASEVTVQAVAGATAYNVFVDGLGDFYTPTSGEGTSCTVTNWSNNGDGTITLQVVIPDNRWVVVSATNGAGESSAGQDSTGAERTSSGTWESCTLGP